MKIITIILLNLIIVLPAIAQKDIYYKSDAGPQTEDKNLISTKSLNKLIKSSFGQLATGQSSAGVISNYASLDIVQAKFTFNGSIPIGNRLFITTALSGDIDNNVAQLFSNYKLNNNTSIDIRLHFRIPHGTTFFYTDGDKTKLENELWKVRNQFEGDSLQIKSDSSIAEINLQLDSLIMDSLKNKITFLEVFNSITNLTSIRLIRDSGRITIATNNYKNNIREVLENKKKLVQITREYDSLRHAIIKKAEYFQTLKKAAAKKRDDKIVETELNADWNAIRIQWISFRINPVRSKFYMLDTTLAYTRQVFDTVLTNAYYGLEYSLYYYSRKKGLTHYLNLGGGYSKIDNRKDLKTFDVTDTWKRDSARTSRSYSSKVNAYNGKLVETASWKIYSNYYLFFSKNVFGLHFFPDVVLQQGYKPQYNTGMGLVFSFKKKGEEKTIINAEPYFRLVDLDNALGKSLTTFKRNEIGIRIGLPITPDVPKVKNL